MQPTLEINLGAIVENYRRLNEMCADQGVGLSVVTKGFVGHDPLVRALVDAGVGSICDAYVKNFERYSDLAVEKWMIRSPLLSQIPDVVRFTDISLTSQAVTLERLAAEARHQRRTHKVVIMVELGETREGCDPGDIVGLCELAESLEGLELHGIGANLSCWYGMVPDDANMGELARLVNDVEDTLGRDLAVVSGGNSTSVHLLERHALPQAVNHLRCGEAILLGNVPCYETSFAGGRTDTMRLRAEVIEVTDKPIRPWGHKIDPTTGAEIRVRKTLVNGKAPLRRQALVAVGAQDTDVMHMRPLDEKVTILGGTSDCFMVDVTDSEHTYVVGDLLDLAIDYHSLLATMVTDYVDKVIV
ncbi:MAG: alanine racemase [Propionibacteriaceae bacterium]|jgi:predicted amino acid racemase|nr:alanine racemase [Propionibacteriaceae bacterium]